MTIPPSRFPPTTTSWQLILCVAMTLGKTRRASNGLTVIPLPSLLPRMRSLSQTTPLITGTRRSSCSPLLQFPVSSHNYSKQDNHILVWEPEVTSPSWYYKALSTKSASHGPWMVTLSLRTSSSVALRGMWRPPLWGCEYLGLINCCPSHLSALGVVCSAISGPWEGISAAHTKKLPEKGGLLRH